MTTAFFDYSQQIKEEVEEHLLDTLRKKISREVRTDHLGRGTSFTHYRVGQLPSGLWVATRRPLHNLGTEDLEKQCLNAEKWDPKKSYVTSRFAVGVVNSESCFMLVEDLTNGGSLEIEYVGANSSPRSDGKTVLFDFDSTPLGKHDLDGRKYFAPEHRIDLEAKSS